MIGITSFGAYVPRGRLNRAIAAKANAWNSPGLTAQARGERAMAGWDEDSLTMAVEAARHALADRQTTPGAVYFGSTTHPFADRQNAGVVAGALDLPETVVTTDLGGSLKAGTAALLAALNHVAVQADDEALVVAGEHRRARSASVQELMYGDAAAAFTLGSSGVIAEYLGGHSVSTDFVDHYRAAGQSFDYHWEERWLRDEAFQKWVPAAVAAALKKLDIKAGSVDQFLLAEPAPKLAAAVAKRVGIADAAVTDGLLGSVGHAGAAHALLLLANALEAAAPGQTMILVSFGQGCDVLVFRTTSAIARLAPRVAVKACLARRKEITDYAKFQAFNEVVTLEKGLRAEANPQTALSTMYRNRRMLTGLVGGRCRKCGTAQFPPALRCVNPSCHHAGEMDPHRFADETARIKTWASDWLTYTPEPPAHYGMIEFDCGGRFMADITDWDVGKVDVGEPVRMVFRVRGRDPQRGMIRYFWKAAPLAAKEA